MEDNRNLIEHNQDRAKLIEGRELEPDEMATEFAKLGLSDRVDYLDRLNVELANSDLSLREAAKLIEGNRALRDTHDRLRKVGR